jgi:hypothetical protein
LELIKDYDLDIQYHPGKANVVADALSRKGQTNMLIGHLLPQELCWEMAQLNLGIVASSETLTLEIESTLEQEIRKGQLTAISQKLAYEAPARRGLEVEFEVVLKSLQSDQITIARYEVELNDLKDAANNAMSCIPIPEEGEQQRSIVDRS